MALTKNDLQELKRDLGNTIVSAVAVLRQEMKDQNQITINLLHSEIKASEKREIISEVTEFIGNNLVPQLDNHDSASQNSK